MTQSAITNRINQNTQNKPDAAIEGLLRRMPKEMQDSFTDDQLEALRIALAGRAWGNHPVDLRGTFRLLRWRYYFVIVGGRNRRNSRTANELSAWSKGVLLTVLLIVCSALGMGLLYIFTLILGTDLMY